MVSFAFSCVTDRPPALLAQTFLWVNCLKRIQSVNPSDIFVHVVDIEHREFLDWLKAERVNVIPTERFDVRSPHCNKIRPLRTFAASQYDQIVFMDCDTAWIGSTALPVAAPVAACIVDHANPPERILQNLFNASGLGAPKWAPVSVGRGSVPEYSDINNCNGGLYICDTAFVPKLDRAWDFWARWCLDRLPLFETAAVHVDQVAFALAMRELRANVVHLPIAWNYPTHLPKEGLPDLPPEIIHYHGELNTDLALKSPGIPQVDSAIARLNARITEFARSNPLLKTLRNVAGSPVASSLDPAAIDQSSRPTAALAAKPATARSELGKVVVGSGWWCDEQQHEWAIGSPKTRSAEFFDLWYRQVVSCIDPDRIIVTDSASPIKPNNRSRPLLHWIELDRNYGHANDIRTGRITTKYSGFTRSVINGAMYALCCDADFYVYVEQDCLLRGEGFLSHAIGDTSADILLGPPTQNGKGLAGAVAASMLQQSLMIVRRAGLERFLTGLLGAPWTDGEMPPEEVMRRRLPPFDFIQVPDGRSRPIDFTRSHFYAQQLDDDELRRFISNADPSEPQGPCATAAGPQIQTAQIQGPGPQIHAVLRRELDIWRARDLKARIWWRDDDAVSDTSELRRLLRLACDHNVVLALAAIPDAVDPSLAQLLSGAPCCVWQHGYRHYWKHEGDGQSYDRGEFGENRSLRMLAEDAKHGQSALDRIFSPAGWQRVFVPPFHALSLPFKMMMPGLGYWGISAGRPPTPRLEMIPEVNAEIDIMNWPDRCFLGAEAVSAIIAEQLSLRRDGIVPIDDPIGILTHHPALDEAAWQFLDGLLAFLRSHPAVEFLRADRLFERTQRASHSSRPSVSRSAVRRDPSQVTVAVTSCGRQDLLELTLDSFLAHNSFPIREYIVIEDGDALNNEHLARKYRGLPFTWLATGERVGQIAAIDAAYEAIGTKFIFHCEDDWEFTAPGFIEKSLAILEQNNQVLQVWLRALNDTNRHPLLDFEFAAEGVPYRLLSHHHNAGAWGTWHGFSWNPALRRRREYDLIGNFASLDPDGNKQTWEVESSASEFYQRLGFFAAILADNGGQGYVRHLGGGRRVPRLPTAPTAASTERE